MTNFFINSPLEQFKVLPFFSINAPIFGNFNLSLTNLGFYRIIVTFLVLALHIVANNSFKLIPSKWSIALESGYATVQSIVRDQIGAKYEIYTPFIISLFWFILISNLVGNVPLN